jgi:hypothetical protein
MAISNEIWLGEAQKKYRMDTSFLMTIPDMSAFAQNSAIHLRAIGADPSVLINNLVYPIPKSASSWQDVIIALDKLDTTNETITDDQLYAVDLDLIGLTLEKHVATMVETIARKGIHAVAPASNTANTPLIATTGASDNGASTRKKITLADLSNLKKAFDKANVPLNKRILVLCPEHFAQILEFQQYFAQQYSNLQEGQVLRLLGFQVYEFSANPVYTAALAKVSFGALPNATTDCYASVAYHADNIFKAMTEFQVFLREGATDPEGRENTCGLRARAIVLPKLARGIGAIVSVP